jgi:hypothetical protein
MVFSFTSWVGMYESTLSINSKILSTHGSSPFLTVGFAVTAWNASNADPAINGISSPG